MHESLDSGIRADFPAALEPLLPHCAGLVCVEIERGRGAESVLTPGERAVLLSLGPRRRAGFLAARLALKTLARRIGAVPRGAALSAIHTLAPDGVRPACPGAGYCSVAHDRRICIAVAREGPVGIDVEVPAARLLSVRRRLVVGEEEAALARSGLADLAALARAWTTKEAVGKMQGLPLLQALRQVRIVQIGQDRSLARAESLCIEAVHAEHAGRVVTLTLPAA